LIDKRLAVVSNVHRVHDGRLYYREAYFAAKYGMRVSVLAIDDGCRFDVADVQAVPCPASRWRRFWLGWQLAYRAYRHGADLYHFHDPEMLLPMTLLRIVARKPVVYDCHENVVDSVYFKPHIPCFARPALARFTHVVQWLCARIIGSVVVATEEQLEMFPSSIRHVVVRNFPPSFIQAEVVLDAERPYDLVHCGLFAHERGSHILLEMMRILVCDLGRTDCKLLLIGVTWHQLDPTQQKFVLESGIKNNIEFRGSIPLHQVPRELVQAKIGLMCHQHTSQYRYGVASKLFDYMASGLAIVGGNADFDREFAPEDAVKIYVDQSNPREYAAAVARLLDDDDLRQGMARHAHRLFEEKYTAEAQIEVLLQFYREQLATSTHARKPRRLRTTASFVGEVPN